jgi:hypothetical protein
MTGHIRAPAHQMGGMTVCPAWHSKPRAVGAWYRTGTTESGVRQLLVQDPDGYLVRPQESIGCRPA